MRRPAGLFVASVQGVIYCRCPMMTQRKAVRALPKQIGGLLWCGVVLAGCSTNTTPAPQPLPPARQIIANSTDRLFEVSANARNVGISELRRFDNVLGSEFGVCMRASVMDRGGKRHTATYVVFVSDNRVTDRRRALPADQCDGETYQPL
jgi:hypothetical protein